jgi:hypothetical protein
MIPDSETRVGFQEPSPDRAVTSAFIARHSIHVLGRHANDGVERAPLPSSTRLASTLDDEPFDVNQYVQTPSQKGTILYLAYGSNLASEKFQGDRGIKPLSQINVQVPTLRMTFDLPGLPYLEPCFANSARRDPARDRARARERAPPPDTNEKSALLGEAARRTGYRKDRWHKGLVGVVYEVTPEDYAHIIATEGGGASYRDILVDCYPLPSQRPDATVPQDPSTTAFKAHTLFAPAAADGELGGTGRFQRPDPAYAQASARYLKLLTDGAAECGLPYEYQDYLLAIHPYTVTTRMQKLGRVAFVATWAPILLFVILVLVNVFADQDGVLPGWLKSLLSLIVRLVWKSYDVVYKPVFGDGERTIGDDGSEDGDDDSPEQYAADADVEIGTVCREKKTTMMT